MKNLVLFWGWNRGETSYQGLINSAPKGWKISQIPYPDLLPDADLNHLINKVNNYLKENSFEEVYLLGHSLGGALALLYTKAHPERVKHLYLLDSSGIPSDNTIIQDLVHAWRKDKLDVIDRKMESRLNLIKRALSNPLRTFKLGLLARKIDIQKEATQIKTPTTLIWGDKDHLVPLIRGQKLNNLIPNSNLIVLKEMGHDWVIHYPELFWKNIEE